MWYGHLARHRQDACATRQVCWVWDMLGWGASPSDFFVGWVEHSETQQICWVWDMLGWGASQRSPKIVVEVSDS